MSVADDKAKTPAQPFTEWSGPRDPANPLNWSSGRKIFQTLMVSLIALVSTLASSIITPGFGDIQSDFNVSSEVALLPFVFYTLGLSIGPLVSGPLSESYGRRNVYASATPILAAFLLGAGFSQSIAALIVCRFLAGVAGAPGLTIGGATLSDVWRKEERALPWTVYVTTPFLGPALGPLIGGYVATTIGWRWTQWMVVIVAAVISIAIFFMRETHKPTILRRQIKQSRRRESSPDQCASSPSSQRQERSAMFREFITRILLRPIHMACVEPVVGFFTLYIAINFGMVYAFFAAFPFVFANAYDFGPRATGLMFLGLVGGCLVGGLIMAIYSRILLPREIARSRKSSIDTDGGAHSDTNSYHAKLTAPEARLYLAMLGAPLLPIALFWFGWTVEYRVHWISAVLAEAVFACGNLLIFMSATLYIIDFYGPKYGASANAVNGFVRYLLASAFPLFIVQMYGVLGVGWASSLLGFVSVVTMFIPWVLYYLGPRLRERSVYM